jgi:hypothetical protein
MEVLARGIGDLELFLLIIRVDVHKDLEKDLCSTRRRRTDPVEGGLFLDVVVVQSAPIFQLLSSEDKSLLIGGDAFVILDLGPHVIDGIRRLRLQRSRLTRGGLNKDLHAASEAKDQVTSGRLMDIIVREGAPTLELLFGKSNVAGRGEFHPCPGSSPSHCRWYPKT